MTIPGSYFQNISRTSGIFFAIPAQSWTRSLFDRLDALLAARSDTLVRDVPLGEQWAFLELRCTGRRPFNTWADLLPWNAPEPENVSMEERIQFIHRQQVLCTTQIMRGLKSPHVETPSWPYRWHGVADFAVAIDIINPGNELQLPQTPVADELVVVQLVVDAADYDDPNGEARGSIVSRLQEQDWLFDLSAEIATLTQAQHIWGSSYSERCAVDSALFKGSIPPTARCWDYFYTLTVVGDDRLAKAKPAVLKENCRLIRPFTLGRTLLLTFEGFSAVILDRLNQSVASQLGMTAAWKVRPK